MPPPPRKCPQCAAAMEWEGNPHRPFCSERCRLVDLGAWLDERYAIPGDESEDVAAADADPDALAPGGAGRREDGAVVARSAPGGKRRRGAP